MAKPQAYLAFGLVAMIMINSVSARSLLEVFSADGSAGAAVAGIGDPTPLDNADVEMRIAFETDDHRKAVVYMKNTKGVKGFQFRLMGRGGSESREVEIKDCNVIINNKFVCHGGPTGKILGFSLQGDGITPHDEEFPLVELILDHSSTHICLMEPIVAGDNSDALETVVPSCVTSGYDKSASDSRTSSEESVEICNGRGCSLRQRAIASGRNPDNIALGGVKAAGSRGRGY